MKLCSCIQRCCKRCSCGTSLFIRCFHTLLVLGVPATLLIKNSALKSALVEFKDPVYGIGYVLLVVFSLTMYFTACFMDPGYIPVKLSMKMKVKGNVNNNREESDSDDEVDVFVHTKSRREGDDKTPMLQQEGDDKTPMLQQDGKAAKIDQFYRYCDYCEIEQPMRTRHCEDCKMCVRRYDHHCPWLETCVGERNHKFFWLFLISNAALIIWTFLITWQSFEFRQTWSDWSKENAVRIIDILVLILGGFSNLGLCGFHSYLMFKGQTTWETVSREKIVYMKYLDEEVNPFDEGCCINMFKFLTSSRVRRWDILYEKNVKVHKVKNSPV